MSKKTKTSPAAEAVVLDLDLSPRFVFQLPGSSKTWALPNLRDLPLAYRARLSQAAGPIERAKRIKKEPTRAQLEALGLAQIEVLDMVAPGLTDELPETGLAKMLIAWAKHSGVSLGESPASAF